MTIKIYIHLVKTHKIQQNAQKGQIFPLSH